MRKAIFVTAMTILIGGIAFFIASPAEAEHTALKTKDQVQGKCSDDGDVFFPPSEKGVYACLKKDGSGVVCGGYTEEYKKSCDTWPADSTPPSRSPDKVRDAAKKKAAEKTKKK